MMYEVLHWPFCYRLSFNTIKPFCYRLSLQKSFTRPVNGSAEIPPDLSETFVRLLEGCKDIQQEHNLFKGLWHVFKQTENNIEMRFTGLSNAVISSLKGPWSFNGNSKSKACPWSSEWNSKALTGLQKASIIHLKGLQDACKQPLHWLPKGVL